MTEIQGKSILVRVRARFVLSRVQVIGSRLYMYISSKILFSSLQGLIFVVDSNDRERIGEANDELQKMVSKSIVTNLF